MSILVIGGDKLGNITQELSKRGFSDIQHISGRKSGDKNIKIPSETDLVLVLIDFIGHALMNNIKKESKKHGVKITFSKRSWTHIESNILQCVKEM